MSYDDRNDFIMYIETYDFNELNYYNDNNDNNDNNDYNNYNDIEFRDTIIIGNELKDFIDLDHLIDSFNKMHI